MAKATPERNQLQIHKMYYHVFVNTPEGREVLKHLRETFGGSVRAGDAHLMALRVGESEVVHHIDSIIKAIQKHADATDPRFGGMNDGMV